MLTVYEVAWLENNAGSVHKVRDSQSEFVCATIFMEAIWSLRSSMVTGKGSYRPSRRQAWGWYGFVEVLRYLLSSFTSVSRAPLAVVPPLLASPFAPVDQSFA